MRRLNLREKAKIRGKKRHLRALRRWVVGFEGFFPEPVRNGFGLLNWYTRLPIHGGLVSGPRAERWFQRECLRALLDAVGVLQAQKPSGREVYVVALVTPQDLFSCSLDVFWGAGTRRDFFDRPGPYQTWTLRSSTESVQRAWGLPVRFNEKCYDERIEDDEDGSVYCSQLWAVGDV